MKSNDGDPLTFSDDRDSLREEEVAFCVHVVATNNHVEAYQLYLARPGTKLASIRANAWRTKERPKIAKYIDELRRAKGERDIAEGVEAFSATIDTLFDITNKGRETYTAKDGGMRYQSLPSAAAAAATLASIFMTDTGLGSKLKRLKTLSRLKSVSAISVAHVESLVDDVIKDGDRLKQGADDGG